MRIQQNLVKVSYYHSSDNAEHEMFQESYKHNETRITLCVDELMIKKV